MFPQIVTLSLSAILAATAAPTLAAGASAWNGDATSAVRLIAGDSKDDAGSLLLRAGVEIRLAGGWKTYWRYPGDSGVPPHFDFARSDNVKEVTVSYPAPQRIADSEGVTIGYKSDVIFPLRIAPKDAAKPVTLRLKLDYAVCEKLCIPAQAETELTITRGKADTDSLIVAAEKKVPRPSTIGADAPLSIKAVRRDDTVKPARVLVDVAAPGDVTLFAEGPASDWALPVPEKIGGAPAGQQRFAFALDGMPPGQSADQARIRITAVSGPDAIEATFRLD